MLSEWPIKRKLQLCIALLAAVILTLTVSGFRGVYAYRRLAKSLSDRASELPISLELIEHVSALRESIDGVQQYYHPDGHQPWFDQWQPTPPLPPAPTLPSAPTLPPAVTRTPAIARPASAPLVDSIGQALGLNVVGQTEVERPEVERSEFPESVADESATPDEAAEETATTESPAATAPAMGLMSPAELAEPKSIASTHEPPADATKRAVAQLLAQGRFSHYLEKVDDAFLKYQSQLEGSRDAGDPFGDNRDERHTLSEIAACLQRIDALQKDGWILVGDQGLNSLETEVRSLYQLAVRLPSGLHTRMQTLARAVRHQYRTWIGLMLLSGGLSFGLLALLGRLFYAWIFYPLNVLIAGSQRVASGDFRYKIQLETHDEMGGLAEAMNNMVHRFRTIRDSLDRQVKERTREVVRSEQMASVGFLAAGVAHEINNPLASIALCAESLEERVQDIIQEDDLKPDDEHNEEITVLRNYLRMIQDEAFRCKQITERLLDFSRLGDVDRHATDLTDLVSGVIEMVRHVGKYRDKQIDFQPTETVFAHISSQEIKQVVLNLITNALDSLDPGGQVKIQLSQDSTRANLTVEDNGCGMTDEVLQHIFQPFFTRRRDGTGTGLGLSISYRIIQDHGGSIQPHSDGPGHGSRFTVRLPLQPPDKEQRHSLRAA